MSKREPKLLLEDIIESAEKIFRYTQGLTYNDFLKNDEKIDAVIRNFEIIGEAANQLPDEIWDRFPEVDWFRMRGLRNKIVHAYFGVNLEIVWSIIQNHLPQLKYQIENILKKL